MAASGAADSVAPRVAIAEAIVAGVEAMHLTRYLVFSFFFFLSTRGAEGRTASDSNEPDGRTDGRTGRSWLNAPKERVAAPGRSHDQFCVEDQPGLIFEAENLWSWGGNRVGMYCCMITNWRIRLGQEGHHALVTESI